VGARGAPDQVPWVRWLGLAESGPPTSSHPGVPHERLSLHVLHACHLVPEHLETRTLYSSTQPGLEQVGTGHPGVGGTGTGWRGPWGDGDVVRDEDPRGMEILGYRGCHGDSGDLG